MKGYQYSESVHVNTFLFIMETINKKDTDKDKEIDKDLKKKIYYVSKVSNIDNYTHEIQGLFDNPQNYLQKKSEIIIGNHVI